MEIIYVCVYIYMYYIYIYIYIYIHIVKQYQPFPSGVVALWGIHLQDLYVFELKNTSLLCLV